MLRLLSRRRCRTCGEDLPAPRDYPMQVCAACLLGADGRDDVRHPAAAAATPPPPYPAA